MAQGLGQIGLFAGLLDFTDMAETWDFALSIALSG
jgi:hypothetical protein